MRTPDHEKDEIAADIRNFMNSKGAKYLFAAMERTYIDQLKSLNVGDLRVAGLHASVRTLEELKAQLKIFSEGKGVI